MILTTSKQIHDDTTMNHRNKTIGNSNGDSLACRPAVANALLCNCIYGRFQCRPYKPRRSALSTVRTVAFFASLYLFFNSNISVLNAHAWKLSNLFGRSGSDRNGNSKNTGDSTPSCSRSEESSDEKRSAVPGRESYEEEQILASESTVRIEPMTNDEGWFAWNRIVEDSSLNLLVDDQGVRSKDENAIVIDECLSASDSEPITSFPTLFRRVSRILPLVIEKTQQIYRTSKEGFSRIVLYQPPVGIVTVVVVIRLVLSGRLFRWYSYYYNHDINIEDRLFLQKIQQKDRQSQHRKPRSFVFNSDDSAYNSYGGIERIRTRLCLAALQSMLTSLETNLSSMDENANSSKILQCRDTIRLSIASLSTSSSSVGSWLQFIYEMILPQSQIEELGSQLPTSGLLRNQDEFLYLFNADPSSHSSSVPPNGFMDVLAISSTTGQLRLYDALLRLCRDRVLQTTYRLARTVEHWERRLKFSTVSNSMRVYRLFRRIFRIHNIEDDRLGLSLAKAAYNLEVKRLGEVTALLMERPLEMDESNVIYALKATERRRLVQLESSVSSLSQGQPIDSSAEHPTFVQNPTLVGKLSGINSLATGVLSTVLTLPSSLRNLSKYSFRWKADGKGFISIRKFDNTDGYIDGRSAFEVLTTEDKSNSNDGEIFQDKWMDQAQEWMERVQRTIFSVIRESLQSSRTTSHSLDCSEGDFQLLLEQWNIHARATDSRNRPQQQYPNSQYEGSVPSTTKLNREQQWRSMVNFIDSSTSWQRIGEGEKIRLRDVLGMKDWVTRLDILGIPSSILYIYLAHQLHKQFVVPYWSSVQRHIVDVSKKVLEILQQRVWVPLKGIYDDIMNRSPSMMSALGLEVEETSLDHMLRDLNFGDGTPATRQEAIRKATEQYEHDLSHGLFANFARGRLIRLLLIQVQQLKVGMLSALDTIDVLIEGNRIHFKVLAAIPAFAIVSFGTRYFFRALYNVRAKDLRPISAVHNEMTQYLNRMETILLLSSGDDSKFHGRFENKKPMNSSNNSSRISRKRQMNLKPIELGELVLNTHRYLILLDFSSPQPFPASYCDEIHSSLQQFYNSAQQGGSDSSSIIHRLDSSRQIKWLKTIQQKHQDLAKFL